MRLSNKTTEIASPKPLRFIPVTLILFFTGYWLQFRACHSPTSHRVGHRHHVDDRMCVLGPIEARSKHKEAERKTLTGEDQHQQVGAHRPIVVDEAGTFLATAHRLLPWHAGLVDQKSKQDWSRYHSCAYIHNQPQSLDKICQKKFVRFLADSLNFLDASSYQFQDKCTKLCLLLLNRFFLNWRIFYNWSMLMEKDFHGSDAVSY